MRLLEALAAGVRGAENGYVDIYQRGTTTRAVVYGDLEGLITKSTGQLPLDSYGAAVLYVDELVDIVVRDSDVATFKTFSSGDSAPGVEVRSPSFAGVDYENGASAAGNPTDLKKVLDRWIVSAGTNAIDWKVLQGGSVKNLQDAFAAVSTPFYNVVTYGAVGNGTTDDTTAINAAIVAAASAGGGTVVFPGLVYRTLGTVTVSQGVSLLGLGDAEINGSNALVVAAQANNTINRINGLKIHLNGAGLVENTIEITNGGMTVFHGCVIGSYSTGAPAAGQMMVSIGSTKDVVFDGCDFYIWCATAYGIRQVTYGSAGSIAFTGCRFYNNDQTWNGPYYNIWVGMAKVVGCTFDNSLVNTIGAGNPAHIKSFSHLVVAGNIVTAPAGPDSYIFIISTQFNVMESANCVDQGVKLMAHSVLGDDLEHKICSSSREQSFKCIQSDANETIPAESYGVVLIERTSLVATPTYTFPTCFPGTTLVFCVHNTIAGVMAAFLVSSNVLNTHGFGPFGLIASNMSIMTLLSYRNRNDGNINWIIRDYEEFLPPP